MNNYQILHSDDKNQLNDTKDTFEFIPLDLMLKDDAYHGSKGLQFTEWWYFDAALNDDYSIQFSARILSGLKLSFLLIRFDIYKGGHLVVHKRKLHLLKDVEISKEKPFIKIHDGTIMDGYQDEQTGNLVFDISIRMDEITADLRFKGITKGWKGKHEADDWWAVALPRAQVTGTISMQQGTLTIHGSGYHDHNWNVKIFALKNIGWYWGKIYSDRTAITWANILRTTIKKQPLLVINTLHNGYINIPPRNLRITASDISEENGKMIPHAFTLQAKTETATLQVTMKTVDIHHVKIFPLMDYWRYHMKCTGSVTIDSETESIDNLFIAEFLKFR
jgi:predicted secreted hydrolase